MTRPFDTVDTERDVDDIFGPGDSRRPATPADDDELQIERDGEDAFSPLPEPTCALNAPPAEPVRWLVDDLFTRGDVGLIVGDGGSFKSTAALHIAAACAGGNKAFDRFATQTTRVLVVSAEDPGSVVQMRLEAFVRGHEWDRELTLARVHYFAMAGVQLKSERWKRHLLDTALRLEVGLIVLDPFVDLSGLEEENSNSEAATVMKFARFLARETGATVVFVHHANKSSEGRSQARIRGAGAIANASRATLFFEFTEAGVLVEQLKMTYASKIPPFMLTRDITNEAGNRAQWIRARLATMKPEDARLSKAEEFVLGQVRQSPGVLNSRGIRAAAKGSGIWGSDVDKGIQALFSRHLIYFENGPSKSKLWFPASVPNGLGTPRPDVPNVYPGHVNSPRTGVPFPTGTGTRNTRPQGSGHADEPEDLWEGWEPPE